MARPWRAGQELAGRAGGRASGPGAQRLPRPPVPGAYQAGPGEGHSRFSQLLPTPPAGGREGEAGALPGRGWRLHATRVQGQLGTSGCPPVAAAAQPSCCLRPAALLVSKVLPRTSCGAEHRACCGRAVSTLRAEFRRRRDKRQRCSQGRTTGLRSEIRTETESISEAERGTETARDTETHLDSQRQGEAETVRKICTDGQKQRQRSTQRQ